MVLLLKLDWLYVVLLILVLVACSERSQNVAPTNPSNKAANSVVDQLDASSLEWPFGLAPRLDPMEAQLQALGGGIWELKQGCLLLNGFPVILPDNDTNWNAETRTLRFLDKDYPMGNEFYVNGGYSNRGSIDESALIRAVPQTCRGEEVFRAGTQVVSRPTR